MNAGWEYVMGVCAACMIIGVAAFTRLIRINNFRQNCHTGDHCSWYHGGKRQAGTIISTGLNSVVVVTLDNEICTVYKSELYPA